MFARIGTWQGSPEELENWVARAGEEVKPNVQRQQDLARRQLAGGPRARKGPDHHNLGKRGGDARQRAVPLAKPDADLRHHGSRGDDGKVRGLRSHLVVPPLVDSGTGVLEGSLALLLLPLFTEVPRRRVLGSWAL